MVLVKHCLYYVTRMVSIHICIYMFSTHTYICTANKLTQQVGYGNAIGFLVNKGIAMEAPSNGEQEKEEVNPITGQYVSSEKQPELKDMTDEEKEREAEKLFVLFERLKKTGIIDVENPIAKAMQESQGRFEEVDSSEDDN